jgi:hypothetical protein
LVHPEAAVQVTTLSLREVGIFAATAGRAARRRRRDWGRRYMRASRRKRFCEVTLAGGDGMDNPTKVGPVGYPSPWGYFWY